MARKRRAPDEKPIPEKILEASARLFSQLGFENTSMKAIADDAGITAAALYYHFENKQEIIFRTLEFAITELGQITDLSVADVAQDPVAALRQFVRTHVSHQLIAYQTIAPIYFALVYGMRRRGSVLTPAQWDTLSELERHHLDTLRTILKHGAAAGVFRMADVTMTAFAVIGMCEHVVNWAKPRGRMDIEKIAEFFADQAELLARGDAPPKRAKPRVASGARHPTPRPALARR